MPIVPIGVGIGIGIGLSNDIFQWRQEFRALSAVKAKSFRGTPNFEIMPEPWRPLQKNVSAKHVQNLRKIRKYAVPDDPIFFYTFTLTVAFVANNRAHEKGV